MNELKLDFKVQVARRAYEKAVLKAEMEARITELKAEVDAQRAYMRAVKAETDVRLEIEIRLRRDLAVALEIEAQLRESLERNLGAETLQMGLENATMDLGLTRVLSKLESVMEIIVDMMAVNYRGFFPRR